ncbi:hypothetical protein Ocin01_16820 [Orchesella cincta]|uniref:Uncharacterized protein n=1 Tax=Orchesella cincta TaxID=48709 RepID=A0A1D2MAB9_ORCCI|nr:hypothetical protein Ocin01_16820 [Orchesella cincta]
MLILMAFPFLLLISHSNAASFPGCEISKFPIPCRNLTEEDDFDAMKECQAQAGGGFGDAGSSNESTSTSSPCRMGAMRSHLVRFGDYCDPMLWRFARRKYDDASPSNNEKHWHRILGTNLAEDNDFSYNGPCGQGGFICPRALCMDVHRVVPDDNVTEFVDLYKYDCISSSTHSPYEGVCTCGHLWSRVDPREPYMVMNRSSRLVEYKGIVGLNRRLVFDNNTGRCAAEKYGHCSLNWPPYLDEGNITRCFDKEHECVNRSASELGNSIRPFQVKGTKLWYGICDSKFTLTDPFAGGMALDQNFRLVILSIFTLTLIYFIS